jgi:SAM-dependent methyltransferase
MPSGQSEWNSVWEDVGNQKSDFYSLVEKRYVWPYEGFVLNTSRLLRRGAIDLDTTRVLDFGCGQGRHAIFFSKTGFKNVNGIDLSESAVRLASTWARAENVNVEFASYGGVRMPYEDRHFDLLSCFGTFHHVPYGEQEALATEVDRVIRPGGFFLWSERSFRTSHLPKGERIGYETFRIEDLDNPEHGMIQHLMRLDRCRELFAGFEFDVMSTEMLMGEGFEKTICRWNLCGQKPA